ncbi:MAG: hypothetical protein HZB16_04775 [Armatimonadetes bacterium]|nr:hypothetical protein [Armatimonadota bacterium]
MTLRALAISLLLIPLQAFWLIHMELVRGGIWPTVLSLLFTVVFLLWLLTMANTALRRWLPRSALADNELLAIYILLACGASLSGCDVGQTLACLISTPYHYATASNGWADHFQRYLPSHLYVDTAPVLKDYFRGASSLYRWQALRFYLGPLLNWLVFVAGMLSAGMGISLFVRRQWIDSERLSFPIVQIPLAMTRTGFHRSRALWWGFALAGGIDLLNGLHEIVPSAPWLNVKQAVQLGPLFSSGPWRAMGWTPLCYYPFAIGLGFLMPLEMSFSCWFGFLLWKAQRVLLAAHGIPAPWAGTATSQEQVAGVWLAVALYAGWMGRREWLRQAREPGARWPLALAFGGLGVMLTFAHAAGMSWGFAAVYWVLWLGFSTALSRMRAEFGPPCHDLYGAGPDRILITWCGSGAFRPRDLVATASFYWTAREAARSLPQPHQIEGLYLAGGRLATRHTVPAMLGAALFGAACTVWVVLHYGFQHGAESRFMGPAWWFATEGFGRVDNWLLNPVKPSHSGQAAMVSALLLSLLALGARSRLLWFTFHPAGYAISSWWAIHFLWFPLLLAWLVKRAVIRFGGARAYAQWRPFFFGLVLGEFVVGSLWQIAGLVFGFTAYAFWI